ncbi:MAG: hypothetical protein AAB685_01765 [Patescibacteria group bacterium]
MNTDRRSEQGHTRAAQLEFVIPLHAIGIDSGLDPFERAGQIENTEVAKILRDFTKAGAKLLVPGLTQDIQEALLLIDVKVYPVDGHQASRKKNGVDLQALAAGMVMVEDETGVLLTNLGDPRLVNLTGFSHDATRKMLLVSPKVEAESWGRKIRLGTDNAGTNLVIYVNSRPSALIETQGNRTIPSLVRALNRISSSEEAIIDNVVLPEIRDGITTLAQEATFLKQLRSLRLKEYEPPKGSTDKAIIQILLSHCEESVVVSGQARDRLSNQVSEFIKRKNPIIISISFALGMRIPNPLKFKESNTNMPTYGWLHFGNFMATIGEKIKRIYPPGIRVVVFDEASLLSELASIPAGAVEKHLAATSILLRSVDAPIEVIPLTKDMFPQGEVQNISATVGDDKIYSMVCSRPDMRDEQVMNPLYTNRQDRSYAQMKQLVGEKVWQESRRTAEVIAQHLDYRKQSGLFKRILGSNYLDATVTDKEGRVVLDVTPNALFNHGIPVVKRDLSGLHKIWIVPEYRVRREHPTAKPVRVNLIDLHAGSGTMTFYYLV